MQNYELQLIECDLMKCRLNISKQFFVDIDKKTLFLNHLLPLNRDSKITSELGHAKVFLLKAKKMQTCNV